MYIKSIELRNWKGYASAKFEFPKPGQRKNVVLVGANNGYILKSDTNGVGSWKPVDSTFTDLSVTGSLSALNLIIDPNNTNTGTVNSGAIRLGTASGEGIFSKRTAGGNQYGLELATNFTSRLAITGAGKNAMYDLALSLRDET